MAIMPLSHVPRRKRSEREAQADRVIWALIVAVVVVNLLLMWRIATTGV